ncbi:hypothetical protein [Chryseobacterium sp.]|uniref:hypothetical protein n=1 Tax=Chryseobacterium sp. TaxID=1871047 RepID=UPI0025B80E4B|nr:hypothetical protein [Chryseobacterium sp.]MBV8328502.1 hypothetical protein [Chryseobacterium sp.]
MKKRLSLLGLALLSVNAFSQDYKQKIAKASCECSGKIKTETLSSNELSTQFGLCVIKAAMPYAKEVKKEYNFDIVNIGSYEDQVTDKFFENISMLMMTECSDIFFKMVKNDQAAENLSLEGTVTKIEKNDFVVFHITDSNKNLKKLYWITSVESNLDLPKEYSSLLNKKIKLSYYAAEIFDAKIDDYRNLSVITSLKTD